MGVSVARVSQIESGDASTQNVLNRFITALGGTLKLIAHFGDEQLKMPEQPPQHITMAARTARPRPRVTVHGAVVATARGRSGHGKMPREHPAATRQLFTARPAS